MNNATVRDRRYNTKAIPHSSPLPSEKGGWKNIGEFAASFSLASQIQRQPSCLRPGSLACRALRMRDSSASFGCLGMTAPWGWLKPACLFVILSQRRRRRISHAARNHMKYRVQCREPGSNHLQAALSEVALFERRFMDRLRQTLCNRSLTVGFNPLTCY